MCNELLIACDLHNTLLRSGSAWEKAFVELSGSDPAQIKEALDEKCSRHHLSSQLGLYYEDVYSRYGELVEVNYELAAVIASLQEHYPVVLISSAGSTRVLRDLEKLNGSIHFEQIFTKESFQKDSADDWIRLREMFHCDWILYFGNDPAEDIPPVTFVQTLLVAKRSGGPAL